MIHEFKLSKEHMSGGYMIKDFQDQYGLFTPQLERRFSSPHRMIIYLPKGNLTLDDLELYIKSIKDFTSWMHAMVGQSDNITIKQWTQ